MINFGLYDKSADMKEDYNSRMKDLQSEIDDIMKEIQQERRYGW
jgi:phage host-nuclease inhibitor protein Gam